MSTVDRTVKKIEVYAETDDANSLKIDELKFQENLEPKEKDLAYTYIYSPYNYYYDGAWEYDSGYEDGMSPITDSDSLTGYSWGYGGLMTMQISIMGSVIDGGNQGPPIPVPRACKVVELYTYSRIGSCTITVFDGPAAVLVGSVLTKNDILSATVSEASDDCEDAVVQVRCI